jgi:hypothetical protein
MRANRSFLPTATLLVLLVLSPLAFGREQEGSSLGKVADRVFREFEHISSIVGALDYLRITRPACIPPALRENVIARLPYAGGAEPNTQARSKLAAIDSVLEYHKRKGVFEVKVIHVVQAFIGLHARTVLLISEQALDMLTAEELRAVVAHEIGHEYFWADYQAAARSGNPVKLQELELRCDAVAVLTLLCLGADPAALLTGVSRQAGFNELVGATANTNCYVSMKERTRFVRALTNRVMSESELP